MEISNEGSEQPAVGLPPRDEERAGPEAWRDPQWDTVTFYVPLPFSVRIDMTEHNLQIRGVLNGNAYTIVTTRLTIGEAGYNAESTQAKRLEGQFLRRLSWAALLSVTEGELWVAAISMPLDQLERHHSVDNNEIAIAAFERALEFTNNYLRAYTIGAEDSAIRMLTPEALDAPVLGVGFSHSTKPDHVRLGTFTTPAATRNKVFKIADPALLYARVQQGMESTSNKHPIDDVILWHVRAEHHVDWVGDYEMAVMALQTSVERRVFAMRACMIVDEGGTPPSTQEEGSTAFKTAFRNLGDKLGGGPWDLTNRTNPVGRYWHDLYELRNKVAHSGSSVDRATLERAFEAEQELVAEIEQRLLKRKTRYKRTALLVMGGIGLKEKGALSNTMRDFINHLKETGQKDRFWLPPESNSI